MKRRAIIFFGAVASTAVFIYGRLNLALSVISPYLDDKNENAETNNVEESTFSHPLENSCKYPILQPEDDNLKEYIQHGYRVECKNVQKNLIQWDEDKGVLEFDRQSADESFPNPVQCYYQTFSGGVVPYHKRQIPNMSWKKLQSRAAIEEDMVRVACMETSANSSRLVYRFAFARVAPRKNAENVFVKNTPDRLSLDILVLDSTSLNMFRRHAPSSWAYMTEEMGFYVFEGFTKVGDNSLVNLIPLLTGLRYKNMAPNMPSDLPLDRPLDSEKTPFLWHLFKAKNCSTLFNDDIAHSERGFMNYPFDETPGFRSKPAEHFYRPWHLYHRSRPIADSSPYCFGNEPYYKQQLALTKQMCQRYNDTCHFSFNFLTDITHDDPNRLEALDEELLSILKQLNEGGFLNKTALVVMGDHGNRVELIRYTYVGRIEERMPLFALYLPKWFRRAHPKIERNLRTNRHRLTTHFDAHEMFRDILEENFSKKMPDRFEKARTKRGISLFESIPKSRTCFEANVPFNFCVCMSKNRTLSKNGDDVLLLRRSTEILSQWAIDEFSQKSLSLDCNLSSLSVVITDLSAFTTNQYVQHGVRNVSDTEEVNSSVASRWLPGDIEYLEAAFAVEPLGVKGVAQLQHDKIGKKLFLHLDPLILTKSSHWSKRC